MDIKMYGGGCVVSNGKAQVELFKSFEANDDGVKSWGINWDGMGTVSPEFTREFVAVLEAAIVKCEELNRESK